MSHNVTTGQVQDEADAIFAKLTALEALWPDVTTRPAELVALHAELQTAFELAAIEWPALSNPGGTNKP